MISDREYVGFVIENFRHKDESISLKTLPRIFHSPITIRRLFDTKPLLNMIWFLLLAQPLGGIN